MPDYIKTWNYRHALSGMYYSANVLMTVQFLHTIPDVLLHICQQVVAGYEVLIH